MVGLETLAKWNGFTVAAHERRCGICGAIGHMGFECPENSDQTFVAQVVCAICGDKGHPTQDCPQRVYQDGSEEPINPQWKEEAEKLWQAVNDLTTEIRGISVEMGYIRKGLTWVILLLAAGTGIDVSGVI